MKTKLRITLTIPSLLALAQKRSIKFRGNDTEIELCLGSEIVSLDIQVLPEFKTGIKQQNLKDMN